MGGGNSKVAPVDGWKGSRERVEQWATSELEMETFSFHWSIKNYSDLSSEFIRSPTFKGGPKGCHEWKLNVCPKNKIDDMEYLSVYLLLIGSGDGEGDTKTGRKVRARYQFSLLDPGGYHLKQLGGLTQGMNEFSKGEDWGYAKFFKRNDIVELIQDCMNDTLTIHCRVWAEVDLRHRLGQGGMSLNNNADEVNGRGYQGLSSNLQELLSDPKFSDLTVSTSTKTFMVHKAILSARSSVFRAMLNADMLESAMNTIEIPDFEEDVVKAMLEYIYTGKTDYLDEKAADLMQISDKYDLGELKEECSLALVRNLSVENAVGWS